MTSKPYVCLLCVRERCGYFCMFCTCTKLTVQMQFRHCHSKNKQKKKTIVKDEMAAVGSHLHLVFLKDFLGKPEAIGYLTVFSQDLGM